jgi:catechol O-methyltransferase
VEDSATPGHAAEGKTWRTIEHDTHVEYQSLLKDLVLESEYLGEPA